MRVTSGDAGGDARAPGSIPVTSGAFTSAPPGVTVEPGKTITWTNTDLSPHQVTVAGQQPQERTSW